MRRRRALRQQVERLFAFRLAGRGDVVAEKALGAVIVALRIEYKAAAGFRQCDGPREAPAGQDAGQRDDIVLAIPAIDAEGVQFHQFAGVVLVEPVHATVGALAAGRGVLRVVKIEQHRRVMRGGAQQVAETAERVGADRFRLIGADPQPVEALAGEHVEMVVPEIDHHLLQLARAVERAPQPRGLRLFEDHAGLLAPRLLRLGGGLHPVDLA